MFFRRGKKIKCKSTGEKFRIKNKADYNAYLNSTHFKQVKRDCFVKQKGICCACHNKIETLTCIGHHVNSKAYKKLGKERPNKHVVAVCPNCHDGKSDQHIRLHKGMVVPNWARKNGDY